MIFLTGLLTGLAVGLISGGVVAGALRRRNQKAAPSSPFEKRLAHLHSVLSRDKDPRDEELLSDLRTLLDLTTQGEAWPSRIPQASAADIHADVARLFDASVALLEQQHKVLKEANSITSQTSRTTLLQRRERLLAEVRVNVDYLARVAGWLDRFTREEGGHVKQMRLDLDRNLEIASRVQTRMREIEVALDTSLDS